MSLSSCSPARPPCGRGSWRAERGDHCPKPAAAASQTRVAAARRPRLLASRWDAHALFLERGGGLPSFLRFYAVLPGAPGRAIFLGGRRGASRSRPGQRQLERIPRLGKARVEAWAGGQGWLGGGGWAPVLPSPSPALTLPTPSPIPSVPRAQLILGSEARRPCGSSPPPAGASRPQFSTHFPVGGRERCRAHDRGKRRGRRPGVGRGAAGSLHKPHRLLQLERWPRPRSPPLPSSRGFGTWAPLEVGRPALAARPLHANDHKSPLRSAGVRGSGAGLARPTSRPATLTSASRDGGPGGRTPIPSAGREVPTRACQALPAGCGQPVTLAWKAPGSAPPTPGPAFRQTARGVRAGGLGWRPQPEADWPGALSPHPRVDCVAAVDGPGRASVLTGALRSLRFLPPLPGGQVQGRRAQRAGARVGSVGHREIGKARAFGDHPWNPL